MINNKYKYCISALIAFILLGLQSCNNEDSLVFEKQRFDTSILKNCDTTDCASVGISIIQALNKTKPAIMINSFIEDKVCGILAVGEKNPEENIERGIQAFNDFYLEFKNEFSSESIPYEAEINSDITFQNNEIICIAMDSYTFTGGAHGYGGVAFLNFDQRTGQYLSPVNMLQDVDSFTQFAEQLFRKKFDIPTNASINSTGFFFENDQFKLPENIGVNNQEIILYYNTYEIASYAEGAIVLKIPKSEVFSYFRLNIL
ncbi:MAG: hypothetical protein CL613_00920 [Aquimarina sp.]|nr:hypothetical protein [Aquimarina sp.]